jgi:hypothetical protein
MVQLHKHNNMRLSRILSFSLSLSYNCLPTAILTSTLTSSYTFMSQPPSWFALESAGAITATMHLPRDQVQLPELDPHLTFNIMMKWMYKISNFSWKEMCRY